MTIAEAYEKYKHLDHLLSDPKWLAKEFRGYILYDLWTAIREEARRPARAADLAHGLTGAGVLSVGSGPTKRGQDMTKTQADKIREILTSDDWTEGEKFIVKWQFNRTMKLLSHFKTALIEAICLADDDNLGQLRCGFPDEVKGFLEWNRGDLAKRLRATGLDI